MDNNLQHKRNLQLYVNRAYNHGRRHDEKNFLDDVRHAAACDAITFDDAKPLLDAYLHGVSITISHRLTTSFMKRTSSSSMPPTRERLTRASRERPMPELDYYIKRAPTKKRYKLMLLTVQAHISDVLIARRRQLSRAQKPSTKL